MASIPARRMADPDGLQVRRPRGPSLLIPPGELEWRFSTSGGPGGQHVNTSNTRVEVRLDLEASPSLTESERSLLVARLGPTVSVTASDRRSQSRNRALALSRLALRLEEALFVEPARRPTRPTLASKRRRLDAKRQQSERKQGRRPPGNDA
ncbi:MAG: alternative ribosome rescue aminoacyl-tRNA hydrolase ArfB [Actinomycetes bacterium]